ncbi:chromosome partitioning protein ParA, partial [Actinomadura luteofluorescens]
RLAILLSANRAVTCPLKTPTGLGQGLLDAISLNNQQRSMWEPALWPYREAAVVDADDLESASTLLADVAGSILIAANLPASAPPDSLPGNANPHYDLGGFLAALDSRITARNEPARVHDDAGIVIVGGFPEPVIGRATRIAAAREHVRRTSESHEQAEEKLKAAKQQVIAAERRQKGARAAAEVVRLDNQIGVLRQKDQAARDERVKLAPVLNAAQAERDEVLRLAGVRQQKIESLQRQKDTLDDANKSRRHTRETLVKERSQLGLLELTARWNGTVDSAREHLLDLPEHQQSWTADDWWEEARSQIAEAISECFPPTATASMPMEIAVQRDEFSQRGPGSVGRAQAAFPLLHHALHVYLRQLEDTDQYERQQIAIQREERHRSLDSALIGHEEAVQASRAHRGALTSAIKKKLADVAAEFDRLDMAHGGYGATLQYDEPPPPADPTEAWDWKVTPMWRRARGRRLIPYNRRANTAQIDDRAIKLVCAAAAASGTGRPLVLVLDELGRNLGKQHRREAVALLGQIGRESGITVVGALQDDMESYAIDACGQYIKLRRSSDSSPYNEQPVVVGYDDHAPRVELLRAWLTGNDYCEPA